MKNSFVKKLLIAIGGLVIIVATALSVVLIIKSRKPDNPKEDDFSIQGSWFVYQYADNYVDNEFMVFGNEKVSDYRSGTKIIESNYTYEDNVLVINDLSKNFAVTIRNNNAIVLTEPTSIEWKLLRVSDDTESITTVTTENIVGDYNVLRVAFEERTNETMSFTSNLLTDTRNGQQYFSSSYSIETEKHILHANSLSKDYLVFKNKNLLFLIDCSERYVWELEKK